MKIFDFNKLESFPYEQREKNVFYKSSGFKMRIIELPEGGKMSKCEMDSFVIFYITQGAAHITVNEQTVKVCYGQVLVTEPAVLSIKTRSGAKIMGIQVKSK